jgi:ABC-type nitrate/sulfonate/bicarbonate transport system substrate-binding protein
VIGYTALSYWAFGDKVHGGAVELTAGGRDGMAKIIASASARRRCAGGARRDFRWAAIFAFAALFWTRTAIAADELVLQLHGPAQFEFAGYYAALWRDFYKEAGLSVEIRPGAARGRPAVDAIREVTEGRAQLGTGPATQLVIRTAQGQSLLLLAPIFQASGAALFYRADADLPSPAALTNVKLGRLPASDSLDIELMASLKAEGIDPGKLKSVPLEAGQTLPALADRSVDAVMGSAWDFPWQARERGLALKSFNPADYRVEFYGGTLFTTQHYGKTQPDIVRRFREASLKGWDNALQHPDEIIARLLTSPPPPAAGGDPAGFARYQAELARRLARYPEVPLGHTNPERWARIEASLLSSGALLRTVDADSFVYDPDADSRNSNDLRSLLLLGAAVLVAVVLGAVLVWRGRRRAAAVPFSTSVRMIAGPVEKPASERESFEESTTVEPEAMPAAPREEPAPVMTPVTVADFTPPPAGRSNVVDLNQVLSRFERTLRQRMPTRINLRLSLLPELWRCRTDPRVVRKLVLDLTTAAVGDIEADGSLIVGTRNFSFDEGNLGDFPGARSGEYVRVTVRDNGPGLSPEALDQVFEPGVTPRPAVAIAEPIMRSLGGFTRVESAEGVGTAVHLYFTRSTEAARAKLAKAAE